MKEIDEYTMMINAGEQFVIKDIDSGSKGLIPIFVDDGYSVNVIKVDKGLLENETEGERACDFMLISVNETNSQKVVCMAEIKGTENGTEITHAYTQIIQSICRLDAVYFNGSDYVMAAVAGAQDKTLPSMINKEKKELCKKLFSKSRQKVKDMEKLVFYVQPNKRIKKASINTSKKPSVIECHSKKGAEIPVPSMLLKVVGM